MNDVLMNGGYRFYVRPAFAINLLVDFDVLRLEDISRRGFAKDPNGRIDPA